MQDSSDRKAANACERREYDGRNGALPVFTVPDVIAAVVVAVAAVVVDDWRIARQAAHGGPRPKAVKATAELPLQ